MGHMKEAGGNVLKERLGTWVYACEQQMSCEEAVELFLGRWYCGPDICHGE